MVNLGLMQPLLAQVNFGGTWSSILGIALAGSGVALYALRSMRPRLARDHDIFFAAVALLCGGILFFQGWRQDPILQFGQFLLTASAVFFAVESIRLRSITTEQAKRNAPVEDFDRPVSRVYKAEFDDALNPYEDRPVRRRIQGSRDSRPERDEYDETATERRGARRNLTERSDDRPRRRRSRSESEFGETSFGESSNTREDIYGDDRSSRRGSASRSGNEAPESNRSRRSRSAEDEPTRRRSRTEESSSSEYVDYRPIDPDDDKWNEY